MASETAKTLSEILDAMKRMEKLLSGMREQSHENAKLLHRLVRATASDEQTFKRR